MGSLAVSSSVVLNIMPYWTWVYKYVLKYSALYAVRYVLEYVYMAVPFYIFCEILMLILKALEYFYYHQKSKRIPKFLNFLNACCDFFDGDILNGQKPMI